MSVVSRWKARLRTREGLLARARRRHVWLHTAATRAHLVKRKAQVAYAQRVVDRHKAVARGVSPKGVAFIAGYEGFVGHAYKPVAAEPYWTIGYGHYGPDVKPQQRISRAAALDLLHRDIESRYAPPVLALELPRQQMTDAIVSAVYNLGPGVLQRGRSLGDALHEQNWRAAANALLLYDRDVQGRRLPGLTARRRAERRMFLS